MNAKKYIKKLTTYIYKYNKHAPIKMIRHTSQLKNENEKYKIKNNNNNNDH